MATVTHVCTIDYVVKMHGEDPELFEAIVYNDDNLTYEAIISVDTSSEEPPRPSQTTASKNFGTC